MNDKKINELLSGCMPLSEMAMNNFRDLTFPELVDCRKKRLVFGLFNHSRNISRTIIELIHCQDFRAALALMRSAYEAFTRALWLWKCASEEQIDRVLAEDWFPRSEQMNEDLEGAGVPFYFDRCTWKLLCSYAHAGCGHVDLSYSSQEGFRGNYSKPHVYAALRDSMALQLASSHQLAQLANNLDLFQSYFSDFNDFLDDFPIKTS